MAVSLPSFNTEKCFHVASRSCLYLVLSLIIAFLCHRLYFHDYPVSDVFQSFFAGFVFLGTLWGLFAWSEFRVFIFLLIPKLFNVNGRTVLIAYISFLTLTGPVWNTKRNIGVMSTTLVCSFEEIRTAASQLMELMKEPVVYIKHLIDTMEERAKKIFAQLAEQLRRVESLAENMIQYFRKAIEFLKRLTSLCEDKLGSPLEYCTRMVRETISNCEVDHDGTICSPLVALYPMCLPLGALNIFCIELDYNFLDIHFVEYLEKGFKRLLDELRVFVDVEVDIDGDIEIISNKTKTYEKIREDVAAAFVNRTDHVFLFLEATKIISILLSFYLFFTIYQFRHKYLTKLHYQNRYLLRSLKDIDELRVARGDPSLFPLNYIEERRFIVIYSWRVTYYEVIQAIRGIADVMGPCFYVICLTFGDYALYYLLLVINQGSKETSVNTQPVIKVNVEGEGFVANYMHSLVGTYEPIINGFHIDFGVCAPDPHKPDDNRFIWLLFLCIFCVVQSIVYPFAARAMHLIMERHYEDATRRRMVWLYNDILRRRKTMQMIIYERMSGKYGQSAGGDSISIIEWLRSEWGDCFMCQWCLGTAGAGDKFCVNCARPLRGELAVGSVKCPTYGCSGIYCRDCIGQLSGVCVLCKKNVNVRVDYGDLQLEEVDEGEGV